MALSLVLSADDQSADRLEAVRAELTKHQEVDVLEVRDFFKIGSAYYVVCLDVDDTISERLTNATTAYSIVLKNLYSAVFREKFGGQVWGNGTDDGSDEWLTILARVCSYYDQNLPLGAPVSQTIHTITGLFIGRLFIVFRNTNLETFVGNLLERIIYNGFFELHDLLVTSSPMSFEVLSNIPPPEAQPFPFPLAWVTAVSLQNITTFEWLLSVLARGKTAVIYRFRPELQPDRRAFTGSCLTLNVREVPSEGHLSFVVNQLLSNSAFFNYPLENAPPMNALIAPLFELFADHPKDLTPLNTDLLTLFKGQDLTFNQYLALALEQSGKKDDRGFFSGFVSGSIDPVFVHSETVLDFLDARKPTGGIVQVRSNVSIDELLEYYTKAQGFVNAGDSAARFAVYDTADLPRLRQAQWKPFVDSLSNRQNLFWYIKYEDIGFQLRGSEANGNGQASDEEALVQGFEDEEDL